MSQKSSPKLLFILGGIVIVFGLLARLYYFQTNKPVKPAVVNPAELATTAHFIALVDRVKANPNDVQAHKNLAAFFMDQKVFEKAAREYDFVIKRDARDDVSRGKLAEVFLAAKKYDAAESIYTDLTVRIPKQLSAWQGLTATLIKEGRYLEAMHVVRKALTLEPDNPSTHLLMAKSALEYAVQFPNPENHAGELDFARKEFEGLVKAFPDNAEIQYNLGRAYVALHNKKNGIAALERAHQMVPKNQEFGQMLVIVLRAMNNQARALTITRELLAIDQESAPTNDLFGQTILLTKEKDKDLQAVEAFSRSVKRDPTNPIYFQHLADAQMLNGNMKAAQVSLESALKLNPNLSYPYQRLAMVYTRLGNRTRAKQAATLGSQMEFNEQQLKRLQDVSQKHPDDVKLHILLANRYRDLRKVNQARDEYLLVLKLDPKNTEVPEAIKNASSAFEAKK